MGDTKVAAILVSVLLITMPTFAQATQHIVLGWETDLQSAVSAALDGDTLALIGEFSGIGNRSVDLGTKQLVIRSIAPDVTHIDGEWACESIFDITGGQGPAMIIENLRIINCSWYAIYCNNASSPLLQDLILEENSGWCPDAPSGGGLACYGGSSPFVRNVVFRANHSSDGGAVYIPSGSPVFEDCLFESNVAGWGGAVYVGSSGDPLFTNCTFTNNGAHPSPDPWYNYYGGYGGTICCSGGRITLDGCEISGSRAMQEDFGDEGGDGGAIYCVGAGMVVLERVTIDGSLAEAHGGGVYLQDSSTLQLSESIISFSQMSGGVFTANSTCELDFSCSDVYGNVGGDYIGFISDQTGVNGNISEDPLYCDAAAGDFQLTQGSPCLPENNSCGLRMGAFGQGCLPTGSPAEGGPVSILHLSQNYPNPFNPVTRVRFVLPEPLAASLRVYDLAGRPIVDLLDGQLLAAGAHSVYWDGLDGAGRPQASGAYFYRLEAGELSETKRMLLLK